MKTHSGNSTNRGSILLMTLCVVVGLSLALGGYLALVRAHYSAMARSEAWNAALVLAESGAEEALAQVNPGVAVPSVNLWANGWGLPVDGMYGPKARALTNGSYSVSFTDSPYPVIYSTGMVMVAGSGVQLTRVVRVATTNVPLYSVPFGATHRINLNGGGISTDSFDSGRPGVMSDASGHYDSARTSTNGDVFSINGPVDLGNHTIHGDLYLGPSVSLNSGTDQISGQVYNDLNLSFPPVVPPDNFSNWPTASGLPMVIGGVTYNYAFLASGNFTVPSSGSIYVAPNVKVQLRVTADNFKPSGIVVAGTGAASGNLMLYMAGSSCTLPGSGTLQNDRAANLTYFGLPQNTSITFGGKSTFVGTIYAPNADLTLNGGGSSSGLIGGFIVKSVTMNGHYDFHFDEALLQAPLTLGYAPVFWREL